MIQILNDKVYDLLSPSRKSIDFINHSFTTRSVSETSAIIELLSVGTNHRKPANIDQSTVLILLTRESETYLFCDLASLEKTIIKTVKTVKSLNEIESWFNMTNQQGRGVLSQLLSIVIGATEQCSLLVTLSSSRIDLKETRFILETLSQIKASLIPLPASDNTFEYDTSEPQFNVATDQLDVIESDEIVQLLIKEIQKRTRAGILF